tara:strand:- start:1143 stop:2264 length:1122 start_codon:yes stop_codon:yes gene_type:complete
VKNENRRIHVSLERQPYQVVIGGKGLKGLGEELNNIGFKNKTKVLVVTNPALETPYGLTVQKSLEASGYKTQTLVLEAGEDKKNQQSIAQIHDAAFTAKLERGSLMIALGGGVIGDMTGFAAATWLRGISLIQIPTTLLAMVDASIGGKTGINHHGGKNLIGAFHQPRLVLIDPTTLQTLPQKEFISGMAEVIKYGVINNPNLFELLENSGNLSDPKIFKDNLLDNILDMSCSSKAKIVALDEHESGLRAILNYGHTFGHTIETLTGYGTWLHGEAVSMGMVAAGMLSRIRNLWTENDFKRQLSLLQKAGLPTKWPNINTNDVLNCLQSDKKVKDGKLRFVLPIKLGKVEIFDNVTNEEIINCLSSVNNHLGI